MRNTHHFKESDKQLQMMRDEMKKEKKQRQQKNIDMEKRKKEQIENASEYYEAVDSLF
jgi:hypothetical protein